MAAKVKTVWENYKAPTPWKFRKIGDFALIMVLVVNFGLTTIPDGILQAFTIKLFMWGNSVLGFGIKLWTNTMKGPVPSPEDKVE